MGHINIALGENDNTLLCFRLVSTCWSILQSLESRGEERVGSHLRFSVPFFSFSLSAEAGFSLLKSPWSWLGRGRSASRETLQHRWKMAVLTACPRASPGGRPLPMKRTSRGLKKEPPGAMRHWWGLQDLAGCPLTRGCPHGTCILKYIQGSPGGITSGSAQSVTHLSHIKMKAMWGTNNQNQKHFLFF